MNSHLRKLASESLIYGFSGVLARFLTLFLVPIYTRLLTPHDYGVMSLVTATITVVAIFAVLALDSAAARWYWDTDDPINQKSTVASWAWCQMATTLILSLGVLFLSNWLARAIVGNSDAALYFRLASLSLPLTSLGVVVSNWFRLQRRPWASLTYSLGTNLMSIPVMILFVAVLHWGLRGIYTGQILVNAFGSAVALVILRDWISPRHFDRGRLTHMLRYALPLIPSALAFWVVGFSDRYFVQFFVSTSQVGLYQIGASLAALVALVTSAFQQAYGPFAFSIHKRPEAVHVYANVFLGYLWIGSVIATGAALYAPEILRVVATPRYAGASSVVWPLGFSYVMMGLVTVAVIGPAIVRTTAPTAIAVTVAALLNCALNLVLVPRFGKEGSAWATLLSQAVVPGYIFYRGQRIYPIPYRFFTGVCILLVSLLIQTASFQVRFQNILLEIVVKAALLFLFIPTLFVLKIVSFDDAKRVVRTRALPYLSGSGVS